MAIGISRLQKLRCIALAYQNGSAHGVLPDGGVDYLRQSAAQQQLINKLCCRPTLEAKAIAD
jgi:hypothetical protein